jgi:hypothetical protein
MIAYTDNNSRVAERDGGAVGLTTDSRLEATAIRASANQPWLSARFRAFAESFRLRLHGVSYVERPLRRGFRLLFGSQGATVKTGSIGRTLRLHRVLDLGARCHSRRPRWLGSAFGNLGEPLDDLAVAEVFGPAGCGGVEGAVAGFGVDTVRQGELYEGGLLCSIARCSSVAP